MLIMVYSKLNNKKKSTYSTISIYTYMSITSTSIVENEITVQENPLFMNIVKLIPTD
jgi:hypothetical protein